MCDTLWCPRGASVEGGRRVRLCYGGERLLTGVCHHPKGHWPGCNLSDVIACGRYRGICVTGWLKNKTDPPSHNSGLAIVTIKGDTITDLER